LRKQRRLCFRKAPEFLQRNREEEEEEERCMKEGAVLLNL
jgi:hypothetical protein